MHLHRELYMLTKYLEILAILPPRTRILLNER